MELVQSEEIETQRQMKQIEVINPEVLTDIKEYGGQSALLTANLIVIDKAIKAQANIANESVATVEVLLTSAVDTIISLYVRATTIALTIGDKDLEKLLKKSFTYFFKNTNEKCVQKLDAAVKFLEDKHDVFTNIIATDITDIKDKVNLYRNSKDVPRAEVVTKKTDGTNALSMAIAKGKKIKNLMIKLIKNYYKVLNPALAEKARLLSKPILLGKRHNAGEYTVENKTTGGPILNATITEVKTSVKKKKVKTRIYTVDGVGKKVFNKHILGKVVLTVVAAGFVTATIEAIFKKNEPNEFVIEMVPIH